MLSTWLCYFENIWEISHKLPMEQHNIEKRKEKLISFIEIGAMLTFLFEGKSYSRATLYYNNSQDNLTHTSYSYLYQFYLLNNTLEEYLSRSGRLY
jgi:hypothetical protein